VEEAGKVAVMESEGKKSREMVHVVEFEGKRALVEVLRDVEVPDEEKDHPVVLEAMDVELGLD